MIEADIIETLRDDNNYYGEFGRQFLSASDVYSLLNDPFSFREEKPKTSAFLVGGYFHTAILEPHKLVNYHVIDQPSRRTKAYKEQSNGVLTLLTHETEKINVMVDKLLKEPQCKELITDGDVLYETPGVINLEGYMWKSKADIINHTKKVVVDLKTTADISRFRDSAQAYNYDSQSYIYSQVFGYDFMFITICKKTHEIIIYDCSKEFSQSGEEKVARAIENYKQFYKDVEPGNKYFIKTKL
jgi:hypothetical protein